MTAPKRFPDRDEIAAVRAGAAELEAGEEAEARRRLAGRVLARRELGKSPQKVGAARLDFLRAGRWTT